MYACGGVREQAGIGAAVIVISESRGTFKWCDVFTVPELWVDACACNASRQVRHVMADLLSVIASVPWLVQLGQWVDCTLWVGNPWVARIARLEYVCHELPCAVRLCRALVTVAIRSFRLDIQCTSRAIGVPWMRMCHALADKSAGKCCVCHV